MNADQENRERQKQDALLQHLLEVWKDIEYDEKENRQAYPEAHKNLEGIGSALQLGAPILPTTTLRELLRWFGAERRSPRTNNVIRTALRIHDLSINPDLHAARLNNNVEFGAGYKFFKFPKGYKPRVLQPGQSIDKVEASELNQIWLERFGDVLSGWIDEHPEATHAEILAKSEELQKLEPTEFLKIETPIPKPENPLPIEDSTIRVSLLKAAKTELAFVSPDNTIGDAITIMEQRGFSQLPVIRGRSTVKA